MASVLLLVAPLVLLIVFAFTDRGLASFPFEGPSLRWWRGLLEEPGPGCAAKTSLTVLLTASALSGVVGTLAAIGLSRLPARKAGIIIAVLALPIVLPPLLQAVALLAGASASGFGLGLHTVIGAHLLFTVPFVIIVVHGRLSGIDPAIEEAARDLGAGPVRVFRTVTTPLIGPSVVGAMLIAFALSIDDYVLTSFTIGGGNMLTTFVWGMMRTSASPVVSAIGTILIVVTMTAAALGLRMTHYRG